MSRGKSRHTGWKLLLVLVVLAVAGCGAYLFYQEMGQQSSSVSDPYKEEIVRRGSVSAGIQESGTITYGTTEQVFEVAEVTEVSADSSSSDSGSSSVQSSAGTAGAMSMSATAGGMGGTTSAGGSSGSSSDSEETSLEVEEVYVSVGQEISEGDPVLKITDESIEDYRAQLEAAVASARLLVSQEEINVEIKQAEADYTYQMYLAEGETAEETYNATITSLEKKITDLEEEIEEEDDEDELEELEAELKIARNNLTTGTIEAKQTYDNAMTNYKYADQLYEIDTDGLEDDLDDAKDTLEECEENLSEFEEQIGDGIVRSEYSGTVSEIAYAAGDAIVNEATLMTCTDAESVTMTVSVSQDDIAGVAVGDVVTVYLTAYEGEPFEAAVTDIAMTSTSGSSTVNYDVTAKLSGDVSKVYAGMTGEVSIAGKTVEDTLYISNRAVHLDGTRSWVKVLNDDGTIQEMDITTGFSNGKSVAVESGLEEGQTVLIESQVTQ